MTFQQKYVRTEKFVCEREARRALVGTDFLTHVVSISQFRYIIEQANHFQSGKYRIAIIPLPQTVSSPRQFG